MIHFACPSCGRKARAQTTYAGRVTRCPGCGQALRVPAADPERTTLHAPPPVPVVVAVPTSAPVPRPAPRPTFWLAVAGGAVLLTLLCGGVVGLLAMKGVPGFGDPTQGDIVAHLRKHGVEGTYFQLQPLTPGHDGHPLTAEDLYGPGAVTGGGYHGDGVSMNFAEYGSVAAAESRMKLADPSESLVRVGRIVVIVREGKDRVVPILKRF